MVCQSAKRHLLAVRSVNVIIPNSQRLVELVLTTFAIGVQRRFSCTKTRYGGIDANAHMRFHVYRHALARDHEHRRGDESPDGDLALPRPRLAPASPGVASAAPPTLRVSSPRRSRMPPSRHTNFHESLECALRDRAALNRASWASGPSGTREAITGIRDVRHETIGKPL